MGILDTARAKQMLTMAWTADGGNYHADGHGMEIVVGDFGEGLQAVMYVYFFGQHTLAFNLDGDQNLIDVLAEAEAQAAMLLPALVAPEEMMEEPSC